MTEGGAPAFERAFVAMLYLLGERGDALVAPPFGPATPLGPGAQALARDLADPDREARARALAPALARILFALDESGIV